MLKLARLESSEELNRWAKLATENAVTPLTLSASIARGSVVSRDELSRSRGTSAGFGFAENLVAKFLRLFARAGGAAFIAGLSSAEAQRLSATFRPLRDLLVAIEQRAKGGA